MVWKVSVVNSFCPCPIQSMIQLTDSNCFCIKISLKFKMKERKKESRGGFGEVEGGTSRIERQERKRGPGIYIE